MQLAFIQPVWSKTCCLNSRGQRLDSNNGPLDRGPDALKPGWTTVRSHVHKHRGVASMPFSPSKLFLECVSRSLERFRITFTLRTVPTFVTAHTFCASRDTRVSYGWCLLIQ